MRRGLKLGNTPLETVNAPLVIGRAPSPMRRGLKLSIIFRSVSVYRCLGRAPSPMRRGLKHRRRDYPRTTRPPPWARALPDEKGIETLDRQPKCIQIGKAAGRGRG